MAIGLYMDPVFLTIGTGDFLNSFFSTIFIKLENSEWGKKYPITMNNLYMGEVKLDKIPEAIIEIDLLKKQLQTLPPSEVVWDFENLSSNPPWGNNISESIKNLADYFVTSNGENLVDLIKEAYHVALEIEEPVIVKSI
ncbi:Imm70 family immunity protein [uncultured Zobellia sp.]|uniref:Imm70 family immunity protein n=1 Tax=uncultured Zobellia sp. TaxID=255433 RepID=UPI0025960007|nr:Imm70 family immunity protein [uncultured Zobellia sp.]